MMKGMKGGRRTVEEKKMQLNISEDWETSVGIMLE